LKRWSQIREPRFPEPLLQIYKKELGVVYIYDYIRLVTIIPNTTAKGGVRGTYGSLISYTVHQTYTSIYPVKRQRKT